MFQELCGRDNFQNVVLVTTMWNEVSQDEGQCREQELHNDFWHLMIRLGSTTHRFDLTEESAWDIINCILEERRPLQIQREMANEHKSIHRTSAENAMLGRISGFFSNVKRLFRRSNKNTKGRKGQVSVPPQHRRLSRSSSVSSFSSHASHSSVSARNGLGSAPYTSSGSSFGTPSDSAGPLSEQSYRAALRNAINTLKLAQSIVEFVPTPCLKEAIAPALSIAQTIEVIAVPEFIVRTRFEFLP